MSLQKGPPPRPDPGVMYLRTIDSHDHLKFHLLMIDRAKKNFFLVVLEVVRIFLKCLPLFQPVRVGGKGCSVPGVRLCVDSVLGTESGWISRGS